MSEESEEVRRDALALLHKMVAVSEVQDMENADSFAVLTTDDETHAISLNGPFPDAVDALVWATEHESELNKGAPANEIPFRCTVYPMLDPS